MGGCQSGLQKKTEKKCIIFTIKIHRFYETERYLYISVRNLYKIHYHFYTATHPINTYWYLNVPVNTNTFSTVSGVSVSVSVQFQFQEPPVGDRTTCTVTSH